MGTGGEAGFCPGNLTKFCFCENFEILFNVFFPGVFTFSGGVGQGSVRAVQNMFISCFRGIWLSPRRGFGRLWILANRTQPGTTGRNPSQPGATHLNRAQSGATLKSGGRFSYIITCALALVGENNQI